MASGNQASKHMAGHDDDKTYKEGEELGRVKEYLQEVTRKNQDLEEMLLYTTQELEKEKENSRKIVQTLTERLMESREMINKLEVENMRYKKDCLLAVELLQCNRRVDQAYVTSTVRKLSDQMDPVSHHTLTFGNPFALKEHDHTNIDKPAKGEIRNIQATRPSSKKKNKSEANCTNDDRTALLGEQKTNEVDIFGREDKTMKDDDPLEYQKDLRENQYKQTIDKTGLSSIPSMTVIKMPVIKNNASHKKQSDNPQDNEGLNENSSSKDRFFKGEEERLNKECQQEDELLTANEQLEITDSQADLNSVQHEGTNSVDACPNENADEWIQEDKPLIVNDTKLSTQQSLKENTKSPGEKPHTVNVCQAERQNTGHELHGDIRQGSTTTTTVENKDISPIKETQEDVVDNEADKLLSSEAERSEENHAQQILPEASKAASERGVTKAK